MEYRNIMNTIFLLSPQLEPPDSLSVSVNRQIYDIQGIPLQILYIPKYGGHSFEAFERNFYVGRH